MAANKKSGDSVKIIAGSRFRRINEKNIMIDLKLNEGVLVTEDTDARVVGKVDNAYVLEVVYSGKVLQGWVYTHETYG